MSCVATGRAAASIDRRPFPGGVIGNTTGLALLFEVRVLAREHVSGRWYAGQPPTARPHRLVA